MEDLRIATTSYMNSMYSSEAMQKKDDSATASLDTSVKVSDAKSAAKSADISAEAAKSASKEVAPEGVKLEISEAGRKAQADSTASVKAKATKQTISAERADDAKRVDDAKQEIETAKSELYTAKKESASKSNDLKIAKRSEGVEDFSIDTQEDNTVKAEQESAAKTKIAELEEKDAKRSERMAELRADEAARSERAVELREEMNADSEPAPVTSFAGFTKAQIETLYHQGRISYNTYQAKVEEKEAALEEQTEALSNTSADIVGLEAIKNQFLYGMPEEVKLDIAS